VLTILARAVQVWRIQTVSEAQIRFPEVLIQYLEIRTVSNERPPIRIYAT
jgi:hypothetical protein